MPTATRTQAFVLALLSAALPLTSWAVGCGDPSPTLASGGNLHEAVRATTLNANQRNNISRMLQTFDGNWQGSAQATFCLGTGSNIRERVTEYRIDGDGQGSSTRGEIHMEMAHESGGTNERLRLILNDGQLKLRDNLGGVELISVTNNNVEFLHRYRTNQGRVGVEMRWRIGVSGQGIKRRIVAEHWLYTPGGLASAGIWKLRRD